MVGDMSHVTSNFYLSKISFKHFYPGSSPILTPKIKHAHLLVLIWERLQTTTTTPTTPDATVQPLGRHIANQRSKWRKISSSTTLSYCYANVFVIKTFKNNKSLKKRKKFVYLCQPGYQLDSPPPAGTRPCQHVTKPSSLPRATVTSARRTMMSSSASRNHT